MSNKEKINVNIATKENAKTTIKRQNAYIWVADKFPISFKAIHHALSFLSKGNKILSKLQDVLNSEVKNSTRCLEKLILFFISGSPKRIKIRWLSCEIADTSYSLGKSQHCFY